MAPPLLRSDRLRLRPLTVLDAERLRALIDDFEVAQWLSVVPHPYTLDDAVAFIARLADEDPLVWAIDDGALCGVIGLESELGYWIARDRWGQGYGTEAAHRALRWHFSQGAGTDVLAGHFLDNARSARVLNKLGFVETGFRRIPCRALGHDIDSRAMLLTRTAFLARLRPSA